MKEYVIFGAGQFGRQALQNYNGNVDFIIDNDILKHGTSIDGVEIFPVDKVKGDTFHNILIAGRDYEAMSHQLDQLGVKNYSYFGNDPRAYFTTNELVYNPYINDGNRDVDEETRIQLNQNDQTIEAVNRKVEELFNKDILFDHVEIETVNRCNGTCDFCPVSAGNDKRDYKRMTDVLFKKIINELSELDYRGKLACFSNNEPFLDLDILARLKYAREKLPNARMHLFSNGTLLTIERFIEAIKYLDEFVIDNYDQGLKLIPTCEAIKTYCEDKPDICSKVTIVLRKPQEILSTRGGDAPNRKQMVSYAKDRCVLPFKQLIIRPDGKVSLCCNDPMGKVTLGDVSKERLIDVWNGDKFRNVRNAIYKGRSFLDHCRFCDTFSLQ